MVGKDAITRSDIGRLTRRPCRYKTSQDAGSRVHAQLYAGCNACWTSCRHTWQLRRALKAKPAAHGIIAVTQWRLHSFALPAAPASSCVIPLGEARAQQPRHFIILVLAAAGAQPRCQSPGTPRRRRGAASVRAARRCRRSCRSVACCRAPTLREVHHPRWCTSGVGPCTLMHSGALGDLVQRDPCGCGRRRCAWRLLRCGRLAQLHRRHRGAQRRRRRRQRRGRWQQVHLHAAERTLPSAAIP